MRLSIHNNDIIYHLLNNYYELGIMLSFLSLSLSFSKRKSFISFFILTESGD